MRLRTTAAGLGLRFLRTRLGGSIFCRWIWPVIGSNYPKQPLRQTDRLTAFFHPSPAYAFHVLLVPKKSIPSLTALGMEDRELLFDLVQMVESLVQEFGLKETGYRLIVNGGKYQEIPLLHWHLVSDNEAHSR